jgi:hypothetical protein
LEVAPEEGVPYHVRPKTGKESASTWQGGRILGGAIVILVLEICGWRMATIRGAADDGDDEINLRLRLKTGDGLDDDACVAVGGKKDGGCEARLWYCMEAAVKEAEQIASLEEGGRRCILFG